MRTNSNKRLRDLEKMQSLSDYIVSVINKNKDKNAITYIEDSEVYSITYGKMLEDIWACVDLLSRNDLLKNKIALLSDFSYEWLILFCALCIKGKTIILTPDDKTTINGYLELADADVLFCSKEKQKLVFDSLDNKFQIRDLHDFATEAIAKSSNNYSSDEPGFIGNECTIIAFTSGTSGKNKAVVLSQENLLHNSIALIKLLPFCGNERVIPILPVSHMYEITAGILIPIFWGATFCIGGGAKRLMKDLKLFRPTVLIVVPIILDSFVRHMTYEIKKQNKEKQFSRMISLSRRCLKYGIDLRPFLFRKMRAALGGKVRCISVGGASANQQTLCFLNDIGIVPYEGYGITECSPVITSNAPYALRIGSVGVVPDQNYYEVQIIEGEICVKGSTVFQEYYHNEEGTRSAVTDGWFHTGDCGYFDSDGFLYVTGRKKNIIVLSDGNNIMPEELENEIYLCPYVHTVLVSAKQYDRNKYICAEVYLNSMEFLDENKSELENRVRDYIKQLNTRLPMYKQIRKVIFVDKDMPKTRVGKVKRYMLEEIENLKK